METTTPFQKTVGPKEMFIIGGAWLGMNAFFAFDVASIPLFFNARIEQKWVVGLILGMMGGFGIVMAPVVGMMSDKVRHRLGRRRPLMIVGLPFFVIVLVMTQYIPWVWLMALIWPLAYFFHLIVERPWSALIPDLFPPHKRATANGVCQLMGGCGNLVYFLVGAYLWARSEEATFYLVAAVYLVGVLAVVFGIKERPSHLDESRPGTGGSPLNYFRGLLKQRDLLRFTFAQLFWQTGLQGVLPWLTSFGTKDMGMSLELSFMLLALAVGIQIVFSVPVGMLADKVGHKLVASAGLAIFAIINICIVFVHSVPLLFVLMGIVALGFCIVLVVPYAIVVNLIPAERMGEFLGVAWVSIYISVFFGRLLTGFLIDSFGSYRAIFVFAAVSHVVGLLLLQGVKEKKTHSAAA